MDKICHLQLNDDQAQEVAKLIHTKSTTEAGRGELEKIFTEAEQFGKGKGYTVKSMWESEISSMEYFNEDQLTNCKNHVYSSYLYFPQYRNDNRLSAATIRIGTCMVKIRWAG